MPLNKRFLKVTISLPGGDVVLDESLDMRVSVQKAALAIQNRATIDITGLSTSLRLKLLSQFTAFHERQVEQGQANQDWIPIQIEAGFVNTPTISANGSPQTFSTQQTGVIFVGHVVQLSISDGPPNIRVRITCFTRQVDKSNTLTTAAPITGTFKQLVTFAAQQMGFGTNFICNTSFDNNPIGNGFRKIYTQSQLLLAIQDYQRPDVAAFIDNDQLIVIDRDKVINPGNTSQITEFIGIPSWNEWGVEFTTLMNSQLTLASAANLVSLMNPGLNHTYVITELRYTLTSRGQPFYVHGIGSQPA